jgi:hypothetical protein
LRVPKYRAVRFKHNHSFRADRSSCNFSNYDFTICLDAGTGLCNLYS